MKIFLVLMLIFRLVLAVNAKHGDMYNNLDWGWGAYNHGLKEFYAIPKEAWPHSRPNQPPGSIYLHLASVSFYKSVESMIKWSNDKILLFPSRLVWWWQDYGELLAIKLPSIMADLIIAWVIYKLSNKWLAGLYLINPPLWYDSSFWGQTDPVVAAFSLLALYHLKNKHLARSALFMGLSLITKASWAPMALLYGVYVLIKHFRQSWNLLLAPAVAIFVSLPFNVNLIDLYLNRILPGETAFASVGAFNFQHLLWGQYSNPPQASILAFGVLSSLMILAIVNLVRKPDFWSFWRWSMLVLWGTFLFNVRMHERYLFPVFPLLTVYLSVGKSKLLYVVYMLVSIVFLANLYYQWWAPSIPNLITTYTPNFIWILSFINLVLFLVVFRLKSKHVADTTSSRGITDGLVG